MQSPTFSKRLFQATLLVGIAAGTFAIPSSPVLAQSKKDLQDQIDRLERDLMDVERLIYRGGAPAAPGAPEGSVGDAQRTNQFADIQVHFNSIEDQLRTLTGQIETATHQIQQLSNRLDKLQQDIEFRLNALEGGARTGTGLDQTPSGGSGQGAAPGPSGQLTPPPGVTPTPQNQTADATPAASLPSGGPQVVYDHALGLLRAGDYGQAESEFKGLIQRNPDNDLAANAQYWLGETYYVRKMYSEAASAFLVAYQKYPDGPKRPDSLLKLGMSLKGLGQKGAACDSFSELLSKYPRAEKSIRSRAQSEQKDAGCG